MRHVIAPVKNVERLSGAYGALSERDSGVPGIGLLYGFTGAGKSTAAALLINRVNGVFVRAAAVWTPSTMLGAIAMELGGEPGGKNAQQLGFITERLAMSGRPLFVDEADYLLTNIKMLETLRDIHDITGVPLVLIGMAGIERRITHRAQFSRRISQWVEFKPLDLFDARTLADAVCEVNLNDDLVGKLHSAASGSIGLMTVGLARIEAVAKGQGWDTVDAKAWGDKQFFLSRAPKT
jgi:DNA transposition AAA+ family ATPase